MWEGTGTRDDNSCCCLCRCGVFLCGRVYQCFLGRVCVDLADLHVIVAHRRSRALCLILENHVACDSDDDQTRFRVLMMFIAFTLALVTFCVGYALGKTER